MTETGSGGSGKEFREKHFFSGRFSLPGSLHGPAFDS